MRLPRFLLAVLCLVALSGCGGRTASFRYKLAISVNTPDGVKSASSVVAVFVTQVNYLSGGMEGSGASIKGEAVYVDLGPGKRPLIALLTSSNFGTPGHPPRFWSPDSGPLSTYFLSLYSSTKPPNSMIDRDRQLGQFRGAKTIPPEALPDLVTFRDINDPKSVMAVDRGNLAATLGTGVSWASITLEVTDEPVTTGIAKKLPWLLTLEGGLDGSRVHYISGPKVSFANSLSQSNFIFGF